MVKLRLLHVGRELEDIKDRAIQVALCCMGSEIMTSREPYGEDHDKLQEQGVRMNALVELLQKDVDREDLEEEEQDFLNRCWSETYRKWHGQVLRACEHIRYAHAGGRR